MIRMHLALLLLAVMSSIVCSAPAQARIDSPITDPEIDAAVKRDASAMIELRHQVHQHPELSNREFQTSKLVAERLRALGLEVQTNIAHTGVVGVLKGVKSGPVIAIRSELDALPVTEESSLPFKSTDRTTYNDQDVGVAHACGHDIHIAATLGVATILASMRDRVPGTVIFIFQPAEEGPPQGEEGGAALMLQEGLFNKLKPEAIFGMHALGTVDVGQVHYWLGAAAASDSNFQISFHGKQAHAAFPQESIDPVVMAAEAVMDLQTIRTRNISPSDVAVLSVSTIHGGVRTNITPDLATLSGTIRTFDDIVDEKIERRMGEIVQSIARGNGGSAEIKFYDRCPALVNNPGLTKRTLPSLQRAAGRSNVSIASPVMAADDFAEFAKVVPGLFFSFGTQKPGSISGINHAKNFVADDSSIPLAMRAMAYVLVDYLEGKHAE